MARLLSRQVRFEQLRNKGPEAAVVVKLMMACNDLSLANQSLDDWKRPQPRERSDRQLAACMYFIRVELAHLYEGLRIIEQIRKAPSLHSLVDRCDFRTRESYLKLLDHVRGGQKYERMERLVGTLRNNLTFHYYQCDKLINGAIVERASRREAKLSSITRADSAHRWRFTVADDIVDSVVVRQLWAVPRDADLRIEADRIADEVHAIMLLYLDFAGEFIWKYCE